MLEGSILRNLELARQNSKKPLNLGVYYKNTLVALCHALEDFILESESPPLIIAAFQQGKWYLEEARRYTQLANKASHIAIMATLDAGFDRHFDESSSNITLIDLDPEDPVAREWHLMILSPTYSAMVLCQELSDTDYGKEKKPKEDLERKFYGFWTFEPELVAETVELAIAHIAKYNPNLAETLTDRVKEMTAEFGNRQRDDMGAVVTTVVNYLQASQKNLSHTEQLPAYSLFRELDDNLISNEVQAFLRLAQIIEQADLVNPMAAVKVAALAEAMAQLLDLPAWQIKRLRLAALLHRLESLADLNKIELAELKSPVQQEVIKKKSLPKASVLRIMPQLQAIAQIIASQTECWNGSGEPEGLSCDSIPLESRILKLLIEFQRRLSACERDESIENPIARALADCQLNAGEAYDPKLVEVLSLLVMGMQRGMDLSIAQPKIATGIWLLELPPGEKIHSENKSDAKS